MTTSPTPRSLGHQTVTATRGAQPSPTGETHDGHTLHSIDLLDNSPATISGVVVRNGKPPIRSGVLAAAILLGGFVWLLTPGPDSVEGTNQVLDERSQQTTVGSIADRPNYAPGCESSSASALATGAGFQSLVDCAAQDANHRPMTADEMLLDQTTPLGAPHE